MKRPRRQPNSFILAFYEKTMKKVEFFEGRWFRKCLEKTSSKLVQSNQKQFSFPRATPANSLTDWFCICASSSVTFGCKSDWLFTSVLIGKRSVCQKGTKFSYIFCGAAGGNKCRQKVQNAAIAHVERENFGPEMRWETIQHLSIDTLAPRLSNITKLNEK